MCCKHGVLLWYFLLLKTGQDLCTTDPAKDPAKQKQDGYGQTSMKHVCVKSQIHGVKYTVLCEALFCHPLKLRNTKIF